MNLPANPKKMTIIDCREMEHPEPLIKVLAAVNNLAAGEVIQMIHRITPHPLFIRLTEMGIDYQLNKTTTPNGETIEVLIWKNSHV